MNHPVDFSASIDLAVEIKQKMRPACHRGATRCPASDRNSTRFEFNPSIGEVGRSDRGAPRSPAWQVLGARFSCSWLLDWTCRSSYLRVGGIASQGIGTLPVLMRLAVTLLAIC